MVKRRKYFKGEKLRNKQKEVRRTRQRNHSSRISSHHQEA